MSANRWGVLALLCLAACTAGGSGPSSSTVDTTTTVVAPPSTERPEVTTSVTSATTTTTTMATTTTTESQQRLEGRTVVIDPGHNEMNWAHLDEINRLVDIGNGSKACNTTGTSTGDGYTEAEFNWAVAQLTARLLKNEGASVVLTRNDNEGWGPCIDERADIGNRNEADAVVSIHADGGPADGRGFHVIHPARVSGLTDDIYEDSLRLAQAIHVSYQATSMPVADYVGADGFSERDDLGGLNLSDVPVIFLEAGNMRNEADAALLTDAEFQMEAAQAITDALIAFLSH